MTAADRGLPGRLRLLLAGYLISAVGSGTVYPFTAVYLEQVRGLGGRTAAAALTVIAVGTILGSFAAGKLLDRHSLRTVGVAGLALQAAGYGLLGLKLDDTVVLTATALVGMGSGLFTPTLAPAIDLLCLPEGHRRAFAMRYLFNNLGLGVGALVGSLFLGHLVPARFTALYELNAVSYLLFILVFLPVVKSASRTGVVASAPDRRTGYRSAFADRRLARLLLVQVLLVIGGFSQLQSVIPLLMQLKLHMTPRSVSGMLTVNTFGVVAMQPLVLRLARRMDEVRLLTLAGVVWAVAFLVGMASGVRGAPAIVAIVGFTLLFTLGECLYSPSFQPLLMRVSPPDQVGRYSSLASSLWGASSMIGPPLGVLVVNAAPVSVLWALCAAIAVVAAILSLGLGRDLRTAPVPPLSPRDTQLAQVDPSVPR